MRFEIHPNPLVHGVQAIKDDIVVEVLRAYDCDWRVFGRIGGKICKHVPGHPISYPTKTEALRFARQILSGKIVPEVWPVEG